VLGGGGGGRDEVKAFLGEVYPFLGDVYAFLRLAPTPDTTPTPLSPPVLLLLLLLLLLLPPPTPEELTAPLWESRCCFDLDEAASSAYIYKFLGV
jgi:hypothetical protein